MSSASQLAERTERARERLRGVAATGPGVYGAPDPETGERWNAGNVLGHVAEMLEYWTEQARSVTAGATEVGRGTTGYERRRRGIEAGQELPESVLRNRIEGGLASLVELLRGWGPAELERRLTYRARRGDRQLSLGEFVEEMIVAHLESHVEQLRELKTGPS